MSESLQRYFLHLCYNGKNYKGWQIQKNGPSIQATLNNALSIVLRTEINLVGCGRTDTGVHAENFYAHYDLPSDIRLNNISVFVKKLNGFLPNDIAVLDLFPVHPEANARFSAISRTYEYRISQAKNPFLEDFVFHYNGPLDIQLMNEGAKIIPEYSDFTSFSKLNTQVKTNICKISYANWEQKDHLLVFTITADRFLRNMVRAIVGTLLEVGRKKITPDNLRSIIESKNRSNAGFSVPAKGLFLVKIIYPDDIFSVDR
jgi:tRNA pseudouridine38-40 synthase